MTHRVGVANRDAKKAPCVEKYVAARKAIREADQYAINKSEDFYSQSEPTKNKTEGWLKGYIKNSPT